MSSIEQLVILLNYSPSPGLGDSIKPKQVGMHEGDLPVFHVVSRTLYASFFGGVIVWIWHIGHGEKDARKRIWGLSCGCGVMGGLVVVVLRRNHYLGGVAHAESRLFNTPGDRVPASPAIILNPNVLDGSVGHSAKTPPKSSTCYNQLAMPQRNSVKKPRNERQIQLALQALNRDATLSQRRAAAYFSVPQSTLSDRRAGKHPQRGSTPKSMKLLLSEEKAIVDHVLELDARGFPPKLASIREMADSLLAERHRDPVGENWAKTFVKRQPELKVKLNRKYNYKRALCNLTKILRYT